MQARFAQGILSLSCLAALAITGCGGDNVAEVKGMVTHKGSPASGGSLIFSPLQGGKPGSAEIKQDGSFSVSTSRPNDGAIVGKHRVIFTPPQQELTEEQRTNPKYNAPPPKYLGMTVTPAEVEVKPGQNKIDLELVPGGKK
jgi:hypothetical protein